MERVFDCSLSNQTNKDFPVLCESGDTFPRVYKPNIIEDVLNRVRYDQKGSGSCVGQALAKANSLLEYLVNEEVFRFSSWWLWMNRPNNISMLFETEGTSLKDQAEKLLEDGSCFLSQYDLNPDNKPNLISFKKHKDEFFNVVRPQFLETARAYKADAYLFPKTQEEVKKAILQSGCVCIAVPVYISFYRVKKDGLIPVPNVEKEKFMGYHAMILYGWDDTKGVWYGDNSYGDDWGNKGFFTMPYSYPIAEFVSVVDFTKLHWADKYFYFLWKKRVVIHERNFDKPITRAEVFAILARMLAGGEEFVPKLKDGHWAERYFKYLNEHGVKLFDRNYDHPITRGEFITILYRIVNKNDNTDVLQGKSGEHWAEVYYKALSKSITIHDKRFDSKVSRGEVMALVARALGYKEDL